ncbi:WXG100 family type VII secretion target [Nocardia suismassiliense]|uniref:WXG100 family type VII secretion target n=1 Tax=Nocardia suismassiliense TaxID=2077092 RepID=UPI000D1D5F55|nr:WXG100 family type VII secretion target [Nocardia suismassiliense]
MAANDPGTIASNFGSVEEGAQSIVAEARNITSMLEDFHKQVTDFVTNYWKGDANDAFAMLQSQWNTSVTQLNATLETAGRAVSTGNSDLQATDTSLAGLF